jgi:hypothetical protein
MTGKLTMTYREPTPLGKLRAEAWIDRSEGIETWARIESGPEGSPEVSVRAGITPI